MNEVDSHSGTSIMSRKCFVNAGEERHKKYVSVLGISCAFYAHREFCPCSFGALCPHRSLVLLLVLLFFLPRDLGNAQALAAGIFHRKEVAISEVKDHLAEKGVPARRAA